jgi:N-acetylmuramoyl-L-alanine amidase
MANSKKVDYFISIHCNANANKNIHGTESHVHDMGATKSVKLAREFEKELSTKAGRKSRGVKDSDDREHTLQVLKFTQMTSVLVECGFLTNAKEAAYLNTSSGQDVIASALYRAMKAYLIKAHPAIAFTKSSKATTPTENNATTKPTTSDKKYAIQIMSSKEWLDTEKGAFKSLDKPVVREQVAQSGYKYRYYVQGFTSKSEAEKYLQIVRKKGFPDAMIITKT